MIEVIFYGLSENRGGIETWIKNLADHIDRTAFHFSFIDLTAPDAHPCFYEELKALGADFYKITPRSSSVIQNRKELDKLFTEHHFDILHFNAVTLSYVLPVEIALKHGCKVVVHSHSSGVDSKSVTAVLHKLNKAFLSFCPIKRVAVSELAGKWLFGKREFNILYNGIDTERFGFNAEARDRIREQLHCENKILIGHVGAFLPVKNHRFILEVFKTLKRKLPNAALCLLGDGPIRRDIEKMAAEKGLEEDVIFCGNRKNVQEYYAAMDLFLFPSLYEGFPISVIEAQCEGLSCVISDAITKEVVLKKSTKQIPLSSDVTEWVKAVSEGIEAGKKIDRTSAFKEIEASGFSLNEEINRIEELYSSL